MQGAESQATAGQALINRGHAERQHDRLAPSRSFEVGNSFSQVL
jgi:hypothetical protein